MTEPLTDQERRNAITALRSWFISQDIAPSQAGELMVQFIGELMVEKTTDLTNLNQAVVEFNNLLMFEISKGLQ